MRSILYQLTAALTLLLALRTRADQTYLPSDLAIQPPPCAASCANDLVGREFQPFVCGTAPTGACLCSKYGNAGPSLGDIISYCVTNYCNATSRVAASHFYTLCDLPSSAGQSGHATSIQALSAPVTGSPHSANAAAVSSVAGSSIAVSSVAISSIAVQIPTQAASQAPNRASNISTMATPAITPTEIQASAESTATPSMNSFLATVTITQTQVQATAENTALTAADYKVMTPGEIAGIAVGAVAGSIVIFVLFSILVSSWLSKRKQNQLAAYLTRSHPPGSRFTSSSAFTSKSSVGAAYDRRAEEGFGHGKSAQDFPATHLRQQEKATGFWSPSDHVKQSSVSDTASPSSHRSSSKLLFLSRPSDSKVELHQRFRPQRKHTSSILSRESLSMQRLSSRFAFPASSTPPRPLQPAFISGQSALRPHAPQVPPLGLACTPTRTRPVSLRLHIPDGSGKTAVPIPQEPPAVAPIGLAVSQADDRRRSARFSTGVNSPVPAVPPPPLPLGHRRTNRVDHIPSYYSKTRQQQLATPTSALSPDDPSPVVSPEGGGVDGNVSYPPTSFTGVGGEGVKMNAIKTGIRRHDSTTSTADTDFDSDTSLTPLEDESPLFSPTPLKPVTEQPMVAPPQPASALYPRPLAKSHPPLHRTQPTQRSPISDLRYPDIPPRLSPRFTPAPAPAPAPARSPTKPTTPKHQNAEAQHLLGLPSPPLPLALYKSHPRPDPGPPREQTPARPASPYKPYNHHRTGSSLLQKRRGEAYERRLEKSLWITGSNGRSSRRAEAPLPSPAWEPKLTPRRVGPGGDMYIEVHL